MNKKVLIVEDQFVEANDLQLTLAKAGYHVIGIARSVAIAQEMIRQERPDFVLLDIFLKGKLTGIDLAAMLNEEHIPFIYLSANSNTEVLAAAKKTEPYGFIVKPFREKDLLVTLEVARYRHEHGRESKDRREAEVISQLEQLVESIPWQDALREAGKIMQHEIPFDYFLIQEQGSEKQEGMTSGLLRIGFIEYQKIGITELSTMTGKSTGELNGIFAAGQSTENAFHNGGPFEDIIRKDSAKRLVSQTFKLNSLLSFSLHLENGRTINLSFFSKRSDTYAAAHVDRLNRFQPVLIKIVTRTPQPKAFKNNTDLPKGVSPLPDFEGMIGNSHLLLNVFDLITQVAPFDTSVLVLGESGTGKEKIADCIHNLSPRKRKPLIKINCATLPAALIESELFGHEKGSFTGASDKRIGKFEQANDGTIFLDEIGEMPLDLQVKLLRVLQEKEIEPLGGRSPVKIDVRVIAATNRNLEKEVAEGRFRLDLYYRLNVFPIVIPPLRERHEDIPALAQHFIQICNRKVGKQIIGLSDKASKDILAYRWPGNIRELENLIERGVLLAKGTMIEDITFPALQSSTSFQHTPQETKTIQENERDYIISVLKKCKGKIWGAGGAAEIVGVPPTTLTSKMKKLGIQKEDME